MLFQKLLRHTFLIYLLPLWLILPSLLQEITPLSVFKTGFQEGGSGWGTHVNPWLIHVNVWKKPLQYCKEISLQLIKINEKKMNCKVSPFKKNWLSLWFIPTLLSGCVLTRWPQQGPHLRPSSYTLVVASQWPWDLCFQPATQLLSVMSPWYSTHQHWASLRVRAGCS